MKRSQKIIGYGLIALGGASILVGASPIFPIFIEAFVIGGAFFAAGAWVLAGPELRASFRRLMRTRRESRSSSRRFAPRSSGPTVAIDPLLPVRILKLAKERAGTLTVAEVAMDLNVPLDQAQAGIDQCVNAGNAVPDFDIPRGLALYRFPEFLTTDQNPVSN